MGEARWEMPEALPTGGSSHRHVCGSKPWKIMCFSLNNPFKYLLFKCPFLLDPNYFKEQILFLVASKLGVTCGSVGSCRRMDTRSGLPGGALQARSHLASQHLGFSIGCCRSGYPCAPCKGWQFLGFARVLVPTAAGGFELRLCVGWRNLSLLWRGGRLREVLQLPSVPLVLCIFVLL